MLLKKKKHIHEILQFLFTSYHILKSSYDSLLLMSLSIVNVDVTILFF